MFNEIHDVYVEVDLSNKENTDIQPVKMIFPNGDIVEARRVIYIADILTENTKLTRVSEDEFSKVKDSLTATGLYGKFSLAEIIMFHDYIKELLERAVEAIVKTNPGQAFGALLDMLKDKKG